MSVWAYEHAVIFQKMRITSHKTYANKNRIIPSRSIATVYVRAKSDHWLNMNRLLPTPELFYPVKSSQDNEIQTRCSVLVQS